MPPPVDAPPFCMPCWPHAEQGAQRGGGGTRTSLVGAQPPPYALPLPLVCPCTPFATCRRGATRDGVHARMGRGCALPPLYLLCAELRARVTCKLSRGTPREWEGGLHPLFCPPSYAQTREGHATERGLQEWGHAGTGSPPLCPSFPLSHMMATCEGHTQSQKRRSGPPSSPSLRAGATRK